MTIPLLTHKTFISIVYVINEDAATYYSQRNYNPLSLTNVKLKNLKWCKKIIITYIWMNLIMIYSLFHGPNVNSQSGVSCILMKLNSLTYLAFISIVFLSILLYSAYHAINVIK